VKRHWSYLKYVVRHKWFVFLACRKCGVSWWRAVIHDWHKFTPGEWFPYAETFYLKDGRTQYKETDGFAYAWNAHQKRGKHHYQYWMLTWDRGDTKCLRMPEKYVREMVADWYGAGRAITGKWDALSWFNKKCQEQSLHLHPITQHEVEWLINQTKDTFK
jgi:hypothetical protein